MAVENTGQRMEGFGGGGNLCRVGLSDSEQRFDDILKQKRSGGLRPMGHLAALPATHVGFGESTIQGTSLIPVDKSGPRPILGVVRPSKQIRPLTADASLL